LKRPPDRKLLIAVALLLVAASTMLSRPSAGLADQAKDGMLLMNNVAGTGGR
jgi:hypothetical protein